MTLILKDRVLETTNTTGTGSVILSGAIVGFQTFSGSIGNGNTTYYTIVNDTSGEWEVGLGTVSAGTLSRDTVYESSNSNALVNFGAGTKNVFCDYPADKAVYVNSDGNVVVPDLLVTGSQGLAVYPTGNGFYTNSSLSAQATTSNTGREFVVNTGLINNAGYIPPTTLSGTINSSVTTINVVSATSFPTKGTFLIDGEYIDYTGKTSTSFTGCTRGVLGTTPASHTSGATVTAGSWMQDKVVIYAGMDMNGANCGDGWSFNTVMNVNSGSRSTANATGYELDFNNNRGDQTTFGTGTLAGMSITGAGYKATTAMYISSSTNTPYWQNGISFVNSAVVDSAIYSYMGNFKLNVADASDFILCTNNTEHLRVLGNSGLTNGYVGIGTSSPDYLLTVQTAGDTQMGVVSTGAVGTGLAAINIKTTNDGAWDIQTGFAVSGGLRFFDTKNVVERMTLTNAGAIAFNGPTNYGSSGQVLTSNGNAPPTWTTNGSGTVTSVGGTGTVNGITLTGTVTSSGNLTLGGTLGGIGNSQLTNSSITFGSTSQALGSTVSALNGVSLGATTASTGAFTYISTNSSTSITPTLSFNASNSPYAAGATIAGSYLQHLLQNKSGTAGASTNYVLSNDIGTDSTYYGEFGMNSSVYSSGTPADFFSINNGIYFSGHDGDLSIGSGNGYKTYLAWGTAGQNAHVINATGAIGLNTNITGTSNFGTSGQVLTSAGSSATPTWTTPTTGTVTSITAGTGLSGGTITSSGTIALANTAVVAGTYTYAFITVDAQGRITNAYSGASPVTSVTGTGPISSTGGTTPAISISQATTSTNGYLSSTDWNTFNNKSNTNGTVTSVSALTLGTTGTDLSSTVATGTTTPVITLNVPTASASNRGALSSTDWSTFNGKQAALVSGTNIKTVAGVSLLGSGDVGVIGGTYGGTGVNNGSNTITLGGNLTTSGAFATTLTATGTTTVTLPTTGTLATLAGTETFTNKRITPRASTTTSSATPTINTDTTDIYGLTAQAADITSFTTNLSGTPTNGQKLWIYIVGTAARAITWGASFEASTVALPTTTVSTNRLDVGFVWNAATSKWRCVAVA